MSSESPSGAGTTFAERLRNIRESSRNPATQEPYTVREIAEGTGLSQTYIRVLLRGEVEMPSAARVQRLARFFGATIEELTGEAPLDDIPTRAGDADVAIRQALRDSRIKDFALRAGKLGPREKSLILRLVNDALDFVSGAAAGGKGQNRRTTDRLADEEARPDDLPE